MGTDPDLSKVCMFIAPTLSRSRILSELWERLLLGPPAVHAWDLPVEVLPHPPSPDLLPSALPTAPAVGRAAMAQWHPTRVEIALG